MENQETFLALMGNKQLCNNRLCCGNCKNWQKKLGELLQFAKVFYHQSFLFTVNFQGWLSHAHVSIAFPFCVTWLCEATILLISYLRMFRLLIYHGLVTQDMLSFGAKSYCDHKFDDPTDPTYSVPTIVLWFSS